MPPMSASSEVAASDLATGLQAYLPDVSVGAVLGFATGVAMRFLGKVVLVVVGLLFIALQFLVWAGIVNVDWLRLQALTEPLLREGREQGLPWLSHVLTANLPFAGSFTVGVFLGLRSRF